MIKTRIKWQGRKVTFHGLGMEKFQMALLGQTQLRALRKRVSRGIGANDTPMPELTERYKKRKKRSNLRDLWFTGKMLLNLSVRSASARQVRMAITSRLGRIKALANQRIAEWISFSPIDEKTVIKEARKQFKTNISSFQRQIRGGRGSKRRGGFRRNSAAFARASF